MTKEQLTELCNHLTETLRPYAEEAARHRADDVLWRVLNMRDDDLRHRVETTIRDLVKSRVNRSVTVTLAYED